MTDDTQQYRNATEDELNAQSAASLTVLQWAFVADAILKEMHSELRFDTSTTTAEEIGAYMERRQTIANAIMDAVIVAVRDGLPSDTKDYWIAQGDVDDPLPWFEAPIGRMIVTDGNGGIVGATTEATFDVDTFQAVADEAQDAIRKSKSANLN